MKRTENQAFCMSSSPRTLDRVPDGRPRLSRKREGTQGRTVHFLLIPTESPPSKPFRVPDIERTPGAAQLEARDRVGASPPSPGDPQGTSSRARCRARPEAVTYPEESRNLSLQEQCTLQAAENPANHEPTPTRWEGRAATQPRPFAQPIRAVHHREVPGVCTPPGQRQSPGEADPEEHAPSGSLRGSAQPSPVLLEAQPELPPPPKLVGILHT